MKRVSFILSIFLVLVFYCCSSSEEPMAANFDFSGEIIGYDLAYCACCNGHVFKQSDSNTEFRILEYPSDFQSIIDAVEFPVMVNLNYTVLSTCGSYDFIKVDAIEIP